MHILVGCLLLFSPATLVTPTPAVIFKALLDGKSPFIPPEAEFSKFDPLLPKNEAISFILDYPFNPYVPSIDRLYGAQNHFAPRLVSTAPGQRAAIFYCTNDAVAQKRASETGYTFLASLGNGKALGAKKTV